MFGGFDPVNNHAHATLLLVCVVMAGFGMLAGFILGLLAAR